jgi:hypothetical protein
MNHKDDRDVERWSSHEVLEWLTSNDIPSEIVSILQAHAVDGQTLSLLLRIFGKQISLPQLVPIPGLSTAEARKRRLEEDAGSTEERKRRAQVANCDAQQLDLIARIETG